MLQNLPSIKLPSLAPILRSHFFLVFIFSLSLGDFIQRYGHKYSHWTTFYISVTDFLALTFTLNCRQLPANLTYLLEHLIDIPKLTSLLHLSKWNHISPSSLSLYSRNKENLSTCLLSTDSTYRNPPSSS